MSGSYSLRGNSIGRLTPPSPYTLTAAVNREAALTQQMNQPGANQMIGYRFAAQADRESAEADYQRGLEEHNQTLIDHREQDYQRALDAQEAQRRHALTTAVINNPAGAASLAEDTPGYSLMNPEARAAHLRNVTTQGDLRLAQAGNAEARAAAATAASNAAAREARLEIAYGGQMQQWNGRVASERERFRRELADLPPILTQQQRAERTAQIEARHRDNMAFLEQNRPLMPPHMQGRDGNGPAQGGTQQGNATPPGGNSTAGGTAQQAAALPPEIRARLREGFVTRLSDGSRWTLVNGNPVRLPNQ